jgi:hypothetical protein
MTLLMLLYTVSVTPFSCAVDCLLIFHSVETAALCCGAAHLFEEVPIWSCGAAACICLLIVVVNGNLVPYVNPFRIFPPGSGSQLLLP